ncbi:MAG: PAS domain S-box protein [Bacteroidales bacterium]|nr:PAS domain S-box protein [Bacteroidales bacterium]
MKLNLPELLRTNKFEYKITLTYLLFGFLWILFSDEVLDLIVTDNSLLTQFQTYKGISFILVTALLLFFFVKRHMQTLRNAEIQRELAEDALRKSEERLRDILFSTADWVWEIDENGIYTYSSIKGNELFEASQEEIIGKTPFHFMPPDEAERVEKKFFDLFEKRVPIRNLENWNIAKNGKRICLLTNGMPIFDKESNFKGYRGVDINITARKLAEETLKQSEAELNYSQEIAKMGSWEFNLITRKIKWSRNMYLLLGFSPFEKEITYESLLKLVHPDDRTFVEAQLSSIDKNSDKVSFDFRYLLDGGRILWVQNNIIPVFKNGIPIELQGVNIDITEKKQTEQELMKAKEKAEASDRLKTAFLNNISHEIRTPLNGILGFAPMIVDTDSTEEEKEEFLEVLKFSSKRLLQTITDYMDASLIASGNLDIRKSVFSPDDVLFEIEKEYHASCKLKGLECIIEKPVAFDEVLLYSDRTLFKKIISHLIENALKFTYKGNILLRVAIVGESLEIKVKDTGIGINKDVLSDVFKHFVQEEISNTRGYEGSGLGLSIVEGFLNLLDGTIFAESVKGTGSAFTFSIPGVSALIQNKTTPVLIKSETHKPYHVILVAEDDESSYLYLDYMLNSRYKILRAMEGQEAVTLCKNNPEIQLVLMDIKMQGTDGLAATKLIKRFRNDLPIIALTAYAETGMRAKCLDAGCDEYLSKPVEKAHLLSVLSKFGFNSQAGKDI